MSQNDSQHSDTPAPPPLWPASWITHQDTFQRPVGIYHFRKSVSLDSVPTSCRVRVTGDNRYQLFVNGGRVSWGPARGDLDHWRYETVDLAPHIKPGKNVVAAVVWYLGDYAGWNQMGFAPRFLLCPDEDSAKSFATPNGWKSMRSEAYSIVPLNHAESLGYSVCEACERLDAAKHPWGWEEIAFDDSAWSNSANLGTAGPRGARDGPPPYQLVPRPFPMMEEVKQSIGAVVRSDGVVAPNHRIGPGEALTIPANTQVKILVDRGHLTTAYPVLSVAGGAGSVIRLRYAEALWDGRQKGNRNQIEGKVCRGFHDEYVPDGQERTFRPLYWRTFRYLQIEVHTGGVPLAIEDLTCDYTGYPFAEKGRFAGSDPSLSNIWETGWRTARLCAHEHYMDCPYYEQLQYGGDTRIQCLVSLYVAGDDRLMRNAIRQLDDSRIPAGLTHSRYPCRLPQMIPTFALWWVEMLHDFWMFRDDPAFARDILPGTRGVFDWFERRLDSSGLLGPLPWWNFVDWVRIWKSGVPPGSDEGGSSIISLQLAMTLQHAAEMERALGRKEFAAHYIGLARRITGAVHKHCWDASKGLFADTPKRDTFSQHANILAILTDTVRGEQARAVAERIQPAGPMPPGRRYRPARATSAPAAGTTAAAAADIAQATYYFRFYLHRALRRAGLGDGYLEWLEPWRTMLSIGLSTWAEEPEPTRSDCHAWSSHPNIDLLATVLGIEPDAPGFARVKIEPHLGTLEWAEGAVPHPKGEIQARFEKRSDGLNVRITLPSGVTGRLIHGGVELPLRAGAQELRVP